MQKYEDGGAIASQVTGLPISGAVVIVQNYPSGTPATIYAVNDATTTPIPNSTVITNAQGQCPFYAPDGRYQLSITPPNGTTYISKDILFDDPADDIANLSSTFLTQTNAASTYRTQASLAASSGSTLVGHIQSGTGAVARTQAAKNNDIVSVLDFGAISDPSGAIDSSTAFSLAAKNATAFVLDRNTQDSLLIPVPYVVAVRVPAGTWVLSSLVDVGNREVIWIFESGAYIYGMNYVNLQGRIDIQGNKTNSKQHYGVHDTACGYSVISNANMGTNAGVLGFTGQSNLSTYADRDSVGMYVENHGMPAVFTLVAPNYTATTVSCPTPVDVKQLRPGMIIDTAHSPKWSAMVRSWASDGSSLTVDAWYLVDGSSTTGTPTSGVNAYVSVITKVWGNNTNVFLNAGNYTTSAAGFELGIFNNRLAQPSADDMTSYQWGFDCVNLGTYKVGTGHIARAGTPGMFRGFHSQGCDEGFISSSAFGHAPTYGFYSKDATNHFYADTTTLGAVFSVGNAGTMELGSLSVAQNTYIDFHSSGNNIDYDARILATGGNATVGQGSLTFYANSASFSLLTSSFVPTQNVANASGIVINPSISSAFAATTHRNLYLLGATLISGATLTNQYGVLVESSMVNATNNFGIYGNIPAGAGRWNFYGGGTARNYFAGGVEVLAGVTTAAAGFNNITAAAGAPTGVPTNPTGNVPLYYDTTNNFLYVYNGGWKKSTVYA